MPRRVATGTDPPPVVTWCLGRYGFRIPQPLSTPAASGHLPPASSRFLPLPPGAAPCTWVRGMPPCSCVSAPGLPREAAGKLSFQHDDWSRCVTPRATDFVSVVVLGVATESLACNVCPTQMPNPNADRRREVGMSSAALRGATVHSGPFPWAREEPTRRALTRSGIRLKRHETLSVLAGALKRLSREIPKEAKNEHTPQYRGGSTDWSRQ